MNSFAFLEQGIRAEIARQIELIEAGEPVVQETLHFDPRTGSLSSLRSKEEAHDYRYFPEPDLVPVAPTEEMLERARAELPELPAARIARYETELGLAPADARGADLAPGARGVLRGRRSPPARRAGGGRQLARARRRGPRRADAGRRSPPSSRSSSARTISGDAGRTVLEALVAEGGEPRGDRRARGPRRDGRRRRARRRSSTA